MFLLLLLASCSKGELSETENAASEEAYAQPSSSASVPESELLVEEDSRLSDRYGRSFLTRQGRAAYDSLYRAASEMKVDERIPVPSDFTEEDVRKLLGYFVDDNPEYYWLEPYYTTESPSGKRYVSFRTRDALSLDTVRSRNEEIQRQTRNLMRDLPDDPTRAVIAIHDRVAGHCAYNTSAGNDGIGNIYGGLVVRGGVCDAYAKTFQYLAQQAGIPCAYIRGSTQRGVPHAWNAVRLDGEWFYVDVTWDDMENLRHNFLLISLEEISREHSWAASQYPSLPREAASNEKDYYAIGGYTVEYGAPGETIKSLARAFAKQLEDRAGPDGEIVYLEVKVLGGESDYLRVKEIFVRDIFAVIEEIKLCLGESDSGVQLAQMDSVSCNFNDSMRILTVFLEPERIIAN